MSAPSLPLEVKLQELSKSTPHSFPGGDYWIRYCALVDYLRTNIYPQINAGLASLSESPGIYTDHGPEHFDEVVRYAGDLIGPTFKEGPGAIAPYDLFLLLAAIRIHDAANIDGREKHERRVYPILREAGASVCADDAEAFLISRIAEAHGGYTENGDKDTISALPVSDGVASVSCRPQAVAALVRISDEFCEHHLRASHHHLNMDTLPPGNRLFHYYAASVKHAIVDSGQKEFRLKFEFDANLLTKKHPTPAHTEGNPDERYLIDEALKRIQKLNSERIYCNQFLDPMLRTEKIHIQFNIVRTTHIGRTPFRREWRAEEFTIQQRGYPAAEEFLRDIPQGWSGAFIADALSREKIS